MSIISNSLNLIFILLTVVPFSLSETTCDKSKCIESKVYKEIGCKPVIEEGQCCATRYDCSHLEKLDAQKCHFKNATYEPSEMIESSVTNEICHADCRCLKPSKDDGFSSFNCATVECPEFFQPYDPECSWQTEKGRCCGKTKVCGEEREKLHKCFVDGLIYVENQWIYPANATCHRCWCDKNYNNETKIEENPNCEEVNCGVELRDMGRVQQGCIPVYFRHQGCCPIGWRCPRPDDAVIATKNASESEHSCEFGKLKLKVGDKLETPEENVTCECLRPPMVECIQSQ